LKFTRKGVLFAAAFLALVWGGSALAGIFNEGILVISLLFLVAANMAVKAQKRTLTDLSSDSGDDSEEPVGGQMNQLISDIIEWNSKHGKYDLYFDRVQSKVDFYQLPNVESDVFMIAMVILRDQDTNTDVHTAVELETGTIVHYGKVESKDEYVWPQDHVSLIESLRETNRLRKSESIRDMMEQLALQNGQLPGDYSGMPLDEDEAEKPILDATEADDQ